MIIFSLIKTTYLKNNRLFKNMSTLSKGNRIIKMGKLFFTNCLILGKDKSSFCKSSI
jgi:hypothetical protein